MACKDCVSGVIHSGIPTGSVDFLHDLPCYFAEPPEGQAPKGIIVFIPDAFGWELPNNRLLADKYAKGGYRVLLPDFMNGGAPPASAMESMHILTESKDASIFSKIGSVCHIIYNLVPFLIANRFGVSHPRVTGFIQKLRSTTHPSLPLGVAGFCWGGKHVTLLCAGTARRSDDESKPLVDAGFTAHPSALSVPADIENIKLPYSVAIGDVDMAMSYDKVKIAKSILEKEDKKGFCELVVYPGAKHGFSIRGDDKDEDLAKQAKQAEAQAIAWFDKYLV